MPSYAELASEPPPGGTAWLAQVTPANMTTYLLVPLRVFYNLGPIAVNAPGDNNHLYGRHRSRDWDISSRYCTNKFYGTTDTRDRQGVGSIYRAVDISISGPRLWEACHRLDAAVRAGKLPGVAEWFGTFDGKTVVGWFEGHASSSDSSHLWHAHIGFWNAYADNIATMQATYATFTGTAPGSTVQEDGMRLTHEPGGTVWLLDGSVDETGKPYIWTPTLQAVNDYRAAGIPYVDAPANLNRALYHLMPDGVVPPPVQVEVVLTEEQLAEIAAAAQAGAEAGAPTQQELEQAAFQGAQRAEDE